VQAEESQFKLDEYAAEVCCTHISTPETRNLEPGHPLHPKSETVHPNPETWDPESKIRPKPGTWNLRP